MSNHTPPDWRVVEVLGGGHHILAPNGRLIASTNVGRRDSESEEADAHHIVRCVNAHDDMLEALKGALVAIRNWSELEDDAEWEAYASASPFVRKARAAIAKAEGKE